MTPHTGIVADGRKRILANEAYQGQAQAIRATVQGKYQTQLEQATVLQWIKLRFSMWRDVRRALHMVAPHDGLYLCAKSEQHG